VKKSIRFHVGGPAFHPVAEQAHVISKWLGDAYDCSIREGHAAFDGLDAVDLFVPMGLFWTGSPGLQPSLPYVPLDDARKREFEAYVAAGKPLVVHHGSIASYDDWPRFGQLLGFTWVWGTTSHSPFATYACRVLPTGHAVVAGVSDYRLDDELYYAIKVNDGLEPQVHAVSHWDGADQPMVMTVEGGAGRGPGAGKVVYLANGHDVRAFQCDALKRIWLNSIRWALSQ
jgi:type 1 glutamine amidotransferase